MSKPLVLSLGEVLWDVLPDGRTLGGAPSNVAWHAAQLGAEAHIVSAVGDDELGREAIDKLKKMGLGTSTIAVLQGIPTSTVDAKLDASGAATYVIHEHVAWDHLPVSDEVLNLAAKAKGMNFGSLAQRDAIGKASTHAILDVVNPDAVRVFDLNLRPPYIDRDVLDAGMTRATVVKMNHDELPAIAKLFDWTATPEPAMIQLLEAYPGVNHVVVTKADEGAWWQPREKPLIYRKPTPVEKIADTIGAGDSVTAAVMVGLMHGMKEEDILEKAMRLASFVCSQRGGMPELPAELKASFA